MPRLLTPLDSVVFVVGGAVLYLLMGGNIKERGKISKARTYTLKEYNISRVEWQRRPVESNLSAAKARAAFDWLKSNNETYKEWFRDVHGWGLSIV